jgi:hypothetical protein
MSDHSAMGPNTFPLTKIIDGENYYTQLAANLFNSHIDKLKEENKVLREALQEWILWEDAQVEKEGQYAGEDINMLIMKGKQALSRIKGE